MRNPILVQDVMRAVREWQRMSWADKRAAADIALRKKMSYRGYGQSKPRVRVFYTKTGRATYVLRLVNQGRERRKDCYIGATTWAGLIKKVHFMQWRPYRGTSYEKRWS